MIWKDFSLYDCDTECRRFMLQSHLDENDQLGIKSNVNPWIFKMLPSFPCDPDSLHTALMSKVTRDKFRLDLIKKTGKNDVSNVTSVSKKTWTNHSSDPKVN